MADSDEDKKDDGPPPGNNDDYSAGYRKPPVATRFQKGRSGNPAGRPRKRPSLRSELEEELGAPVLMKDGDIPAEISTLRAILRALSKAAIAGNVRAATTLLNLSAKIPDAGDDDENSPEEAEILEAYRQRAKPTDKQGH